MSKRRRWLGAAKWAATVLSVLMLAVDVASGGYAFLWRPTSTADVVFRMGRIEVFTYSDNYLENSVRGARTPTFAAYRIDTTDEPSFYLAFQQATVHKASGAYYTWRATPLWTPAAALVLLTSALWWLDRRRAPAGHCGQCGYDLTGNVSGKCPECGSKVREVARSKAAGA